jgi:hypothetical protein
MQSCRASCRAFKTLIGISPASQELEAEQLGNMVHEAREQVQRLYEEGELENRGGGTSST